LTLRRNIAKSQYHSIPSGVFCRDQQLIALTRFRVYFRSKCSRLRRGSQAAAELNDPGRGFRAVDEENRGRSSRLSIAGVIPLAVVIELFDRKPQARELPA